MGFKCGIVGLPNVGKSTIFNSLTNAGAQSANYPFCTIEPNTGIVPVPDKRLHKIDQFIHTQKIIPPCLEIVDIAGLVKGASQGEGLGNKFLSKIREVEAILHVVRCFDNQDVVHVHGEVNPISDVETIETELKLADIQMLENVVQRRSKIAKSGDKQAKHDMELAIQCIQFLNDEKAWDSFSDAKKDDMKELQLLSMKSVLFIANVDEEHLTEDNESIQKLKDYAKNKNATILKISGEIESELAQLDADERIEFLKDLGLECSGLDHVIHEGYALLDLITYFTAGPKEIRGWTIPKGTLAPGAAGKIHTDFEKGFIRAETISFNDFIQNEGEAGAKEAGKVRIEGKDYEVVDGDILHFRFNV